MAEVVDTISEVETRTLPTGTVIYAIKDSQGREYTTKDREIAKEAYGLVGKVQTAHIDYTEKKGGQFNQFTNRYLNEFTVLPEDASMPTLGGPQPFAGQAPADGADPFADTEPETGPIGRDRDAEKDLAIAKAVALKAAVDLMAYFDPQDRTSTNVTGVAEYFTAWLQDYRP